MRSIDLPAKVLEGGVSSATGVGAWPYDDGSGDPFWAGGATPVDYQWRITFSVSPQPHSSHRTRNPKQYNGMDVEIGDWIAERDSGISVKIVSIETKTETSITCIVEDVLRYNTFRSYGGTGFGLFNVPASIVVYSLNDDALPVVDPVPPSGVGSSFYTNVMSRFQNTEQTSNFLLHKTAHGFEVDDLISADPATNSFIKTDTGHPYILGAVSFIALGPDDFMLNPIQKVLDNLPYLVGDVGDVIYADPNIPGGYSLVGTLPVMVKLRNNTQSNVVGTVYSPSTAAGSVFTLNGVELTLPTGSMAEFVSVVNNTTATHGCVCSTIAAPVVLTTSLSDCANGEPAFISDTATATINGVLVNFTTTTVGQATYGAAYALEEDMATDINAANIPDIVATTADNKLILTNTAGGSITIVNGTPDAGGNGFAGSPSASGLPMSASSGAGSESVALTAVDARAINLYDVSGETTTDFGLVSTENGVKAAALYIEQGIRQAASYVVANIPSRDALNAVYGDQCFVQNTGNGEWAHYIRTLDSSWVKLSDADSSVTDAQSVEVEITFESATEGLIHTISAGRRVSFVTVTVTEAFDEPATVSVGDDDVNNRLMTVDQNDLTSVSDYSTTPSYTYVGNTDTNINFYFDPSNSTTGRAVIAITYT